MDILRTLVWLVIVFGGGFLLTTRFLPWAFVKVARALGFRAKLTPIAQKRIVRFKRIKRGYWAFRVISTLFVISMFLELFVSGKALVIYYEGKTSFPAVANWVDHKLFFTDISSFNKRSDFGQLGEGPVDYRAFERHSSDPSTLRAEIEAETAVIESERAAYLADNPAPGPDAKPFAVRKHARRTAGFDKRAAEQATLRERLKVFEAGDAWSLMPLYPYGPRDLRYDLEQSPPNAPGLGEGIPLGTDVSGRDILPLMSYGFRIALAFALMVAFCGYLIGVVVGGIQGYFGGWTDIIVQRVVEIWGSVPFLFTLMIIASIVKPEFGLLVLLLVVLRSWLGISYYVRGEFYREKSKDYVQAAIGAGVSDRKIILKHILPNSIVPIVTFAPFAIVAYIGTLVSLDFLGFGLPPGTPSWGGILSQGLENVKFHPHLVIVPTVALAMTLYAVVLVGEAVREAFDPKVFSRLR